jgi:hypothetical protein
MAGKGAACAACQSRQRSHRQPADQQKARWPQRLYSSVLVKAKLMKHRQEQGVTEAINKKEASISRGDVLKGIVSVCCTCSLEQRFDRNTNHKPNERQQAHSLDQDKRPAGRAKVASIGQ